MIKNHTQNGIGFLVKSETALNRPRTESADTLCRARPKSVGSRLKCRVPSKRSSRVAEGGGFKSENGLLSGKEAAAQDICYILTEKNFIIFSVKQLT